MNSYDLMLELKRRRPFESFKLHLVDGSIHEVTDPTLYVVMESRLFLASPDRKRWTFIRFQNITNIESPIAA